MIKSILITGASPDKVNNNAIMRSYVEEGAISILGKENVKNVPLEYADQYQYSFPFDLVLVFGSCMPDQCNYDSLRIACDKTNAILAFWLHDDPYEQDFSYKLIDKADFIFSNDKWATRFYEHNYSYHLPMAASKSAHFREIKKNWIYDMFFCGVGFHNRIQFFRDALKYLENFKISVKGSNWPEDIPFTINERVSNSLLPDLLNKSKFTFNLGRHLDLGNQRFSLPASTPGPRTFETAMSGTVQLYYVESLEIIEYFTPNKEIILFDSIKELESTVDKLIDNEIGLYEIAKNAQDRAIKDHTYEVRLKKMLSIINKHN